MKINHRTAALYSQEEVLIHKTEACKENMNLILKIPQTKIRLSEPVVVLSDKSFPHMLPKTVLRIGKILKNFYRVQEIHV